MKWLFEKFGTRWNASLPVVVGLLLMASMAEAAGPARVTYRSERFTGTTNNRPFVISFDSDPTAIRTNLVFGVPLNVQPTNGVAVVSLLPGNYLLKIDQVTKPIGFSVYDSTNSYEMIDLINRGINILTWSNTNMVQQVLAGTTNVHVSTTVAGVATVSVDVPAVVSGQGSNGVPVAGAGIHIATNSVLGTYTISVNPPGIVNAITNDEVRDVRLMGDVNFGSSGVIAPDGSGQLGNGGVNWDSDGNFSFIGGGNTTENIRIGTDQTSVIAMNGSGAETGWGIYALGSNSIWKVENGISLKGISLDTNGAFTAASFIGAATRLTNGVPGLATNAATATNGQFLSMSGDRLNLVDPPPGYIDVLRAGLKGGTTNDTAAFNAILHDGGWYFFAHATNFNLLPITLPSNVRILGGCTTLTLDTNVSNGTLFDCNAATNVQIKDILFDGVLSHGLTTASGESVFQTANPAALRIGVKPYAYGLNRIEGCIVQGFDYGIFPVGDKTTTTSHNSPSLYLVNDTCRSNAVGMYFYSPGAATEVVEYLTLQECHVYANGRAGLIVDAGNIKITGGIFTDNYVHFIYPGTGANNSHSTVTGAMINHAMAGGWVAMTNLVSAQNFVGNTILANGNSYFDNCHGVNISGNLLSAMYLYFVNSTNSSMPNYVTYNGSQAPLQPGPDGLAILNYDGSVIQHDNNPMTDNSTGDYGVQTKTNGYTVGVGYNLQRTNSWGLWWSNGVALYHDGNSNGVLVRTLIYPQSSGSSVTAAADGGLRLAGGQMMITNAFYSDANKALFLTNQIVSAGASASLLSANRDDGSILSGWFGNASTFFFNDGKSGNQPIAFNMDFPYTITNLGLAGSGDHALYGSAGGGIFAGSASGAVPANANGTATTASQLNGLFPGTIMTNGGSFAATWLGAVNVSNTVIMAKTINGTGSTNVTGISGDGITSTNAQTGGWMVSSNGAITMNGSLTNSKSVWFRPTDLTGANEDIFATNRTVSGEPSIVFQRSTLFFPGLVAGNVYAAGNGGGGTLHLASYTSAFPPAITDKQKIESTVSDTTINLQRVGGPRSSLTASNIFSDGTIGATNGIYDGNIVREKIPATETTLTETTPTAILTCTLASSKYVGFRVFATTHADDGTDFQSVADQFVVSAVNKAGTVTLAIATIGTATTSTAVSSGTLTTAWTATASGTTISIKDNATSSLSQTTLKCKWRVEVDTDDTALAVAAQ